MGKRSTYEGYLRVHGGKPRSTVAAAVIPAVLRIAGLDATVDAGTGTGKYLPAGAIVLSVAIVESVTASGGTTPILDVGLASSTPDPDGIVNGAPYDASSLVQFTDATAGVLIGAVNAETAEITYGDDGAGVNNTAGEIDLIITYTFDDDGVVND